MLLPRNQFETEAEYKRALRDAFAMAALTGLCSKPEKEHGLPWETYAEAAYAYADDMLSQREETE